VAQAQDDRSRADQVGSVSQTTGECGCSDLSDDRLNLQSWLPPRLFKPINHVLVGFGQVVCLPVGPRCDVCTLGKEKACPSRVANVNSKGRKVVEFTTLEETREDMPAKMKVEVGYEA
jgi:endonuclease-3